MKPVSERLRAFLRLPSPWVSGLCFVALYAIVARLDGVLS